MTTDTIKRTPTMVEDGVEYYGDPSLLEGLLDIEVTLGQGQRRDDYKWKNKTAPFGAFLGLITDHKVSKMKDGKCYTQGNIIGERRKAVAMEKMDLLVLDMDTGQEIAEVRERILQEGLLAIIYTTHSYGSTSSSIPKSIFYKKLKLDDDEDITDKHCALYLEHFKRYTKQIAASARFNRVEHTPDGIQVFVDHAPMQKYRVVFLLDEPFVFAEESANQTKAIDKWKKKYAGLAESLDAFYDHSCVDPSRLFYYPTHKPGGEFHVEIIAGEPLRLDEITDVDPRSGMKKSTGNAFIDDAGDGDDGDDTYTYQTDWVQKWYAKHGKNFMAGDFVRDYFADDLRSDNGINATTVCPFDHNHSNAGDPTDKGFYAANAGDWKAADGDMGQLGLMKCSHDGCKAYKSVHFLDQMAADGIVDGPEDLAPFLSMMDEDEDDEDDAEDSSDDAPAKDKAKAKDTSPPWEDVKVSPEMQGYLNDIQKMTQVSDISEIIGEIAQEGFNDGERKLLIEAINRYTKIDKPKIEAKLRGAIGEIQRAKDEEEAKDNGQYLVFTSDHFDDQVNTIIKAMKKLAKSEDNRLFKTEDGEVARVSYVQGTGTARVDILDRAQLFVELTNVVKFFSMGNGGKKKQEAAPPDIVTYFTGINKDDLPLPTLKRIVKHPIFTDEGKLLTKSGYNRDTCAFLDIPFTVLPVNGKPSEKEMAHAYDLLFNDLYVDFPIRDDGEEHGDSSKAHLLSLIMQPFVRDIIGVSSTPLYVINKPTPGAGSGYLMDGASIIITGDRCKATIFNRSDEENSKVITTKLRTDNAAILFFDNVNHYVDSPSLASALTAGTYTGRVLGVSEEITVPMMGIWAMSGNQLSFSNELARRGILIALKPNEARPEDRQNFKHKNYHKWAKDHRSELVWAVCTIIQNWVAKGMQDWSGKPLGSFETWSQIMGGILEDARIEGFLENLKGFRATSSNEVAQDRIMISALFNEETFTVNKRWTSGEVFDYYYDDDTEEFELDLDLYTKQSGKKGLKQSFGRALSKMKGRWFEVFDKEDHLHVVLLDQVGEDRRSGSPIYTLLPREGA